MSTLTCFVFLAVLLASVVADDDRASCSPGRACEELERRVNEKRDAYEKLCNSDSNLTKKCCRDIKKKVKKYEDAYDVFCATKPTPTRPQAKPTQAPTTAELVTPPLPTTQAKPTQAPTTAELVTPPLPTTQAKGTCTSPKALGMQNGAIPNSAVTASSMYSSNEQPYYARLMKTGSNHCLWAPKLSDRLPWIQIDLGKKSVVTAVATQGSCNNPTAWVTSYAIRYSEDGLNWTYYNKGQPLPANTDTSSVVKNEFEPAFEARFVRIYPKTQNKLFYSMRFELYGCRK